MFLKNILSRKKEGNEIIKEAIMTLEKEDKRRQDLGRIQYNDTLRRIIDSCIIIKQTKNYGNKLEIFNCNTEFAKDLGFIKQDLIGIKFEEILVPDSYDQNYKLIESLSKKESNKFNEIQMVFMKKNKFIHVASYKWKIVNDNDGNLYAVFKSGKIKKTRQESSILVDEKENIIANCSSTFPFLKVDKLFQVRNKSIKVRELIDLEKYDLKKLSKFNTIQNLKLNFRDKMEIGVKVTKFDGFGKENYLINLLTKIVLKKKMKVQITIMSRTLLMRKKQSIN